MSQIKRQHPRVRYCAFLNTLICFWLILLLPPAQIKAQDDLNVIHGGSSNNNWLHYSDSQNSLYRHITGQAYDLLNERKEMVTAPQNLADLKQRQEYVRETLMDVIGTFPEKTPLNAEIVRTIDKDDYRVEHIVYESHPEFYVTSSLFIPNEVDDQAPAVLYLSGHTTEGYRSGTYQHKILNLVKKGFVVFAIDPVGQGERRQYQDSETGRSAVGSVTSEHSYSGVQAFLTGSSQIRYMVWDGIRAVDYLHTRSEVDPDRIGVTGRSGGGTQSAFLAAMEDRIYAAAPEAYITSFTLLLKSIGPQDAEQNIYHGIKRGIDHADLLAVRAPKPALMITTTEDFFSIQGSRDAAAELSAIYSAYGNEDDFSMVEDGGGHGSTPKNREAMYAFFQKHLDNPGNSNDEEVEILSEDEIRVTETGQVITSLGGETVFSLNLLEAEQKVSGLRESREDLESHLPKILNVAKELSGFQQPERTNDPVFTGRIEREGYVIEKYFVKGEGDYIIPYLLMAPNSSNGKAIIYLHPSGKASEASEGEEIEELVNKGYTVLAPDLIGTGEMGGGDVANYSTQVKDFEATSYDVWPASVMIGRSITGLHAGDIIRLTQLLNRIHKPDEVYAIARDKMAPALLHAAAFDNSISQIALLRPYSSYNSIVVNQYYDPGFHTSTVAGSIGSYDLPDLAASLAPRKLIMTGVTDGAGNTLDAQSMSEEMGIVNSAYEQNNAREKLTITTGEATNNLVDFLEDWID